MLTVGDSPVVPTDERIGALGHVPIRSAFGKRQNPDFHRET